MSKAVYPGRFDPVTNGHLNLMTRASELFDELLVGVAESSPIFTLEERLEFICLSIGHLSNVESRLTRVSHTDFAGRWAREFLSGYSGSNRFRDRI